MDPEDVGTHPEGSDARAAAHPIGVALQGLREPVILILILAGFFDGISGNPIHAIVLGTVALALAFDADRNAAMPRGRGTIALRAPRLTIPVTVAALLYAVSAGTFGRYSWPATIAIVTPGLAMLAFSWRGPLPGAPDPIRPERRGALLWAGVFVALALWELAALLLQPSLTTDSYAHPTISVLSDPALASHPGRSAILFAWLLVGWFLVGR